MCGIFGSVGRLDHTGLRDAALTLRHRGPDGFGEWSSPDRRTYLAHCRLAIIDLSDAGRQPMANAEATLQLTFNGEIYNYRELRAELEAAGCRFASHTDSETIIHGYQQWGDAVVERLRGMFAFAIWDERRGRLLLARDRLGIKPLYYASLGTTLAFASEPRALLAMDPGLRSANPVAVAQLLRGAFIHGSHSIWQGIARLPPATTLTFDANTGSTAIDRFWSLPEEQTTRELVSAADELEHLLDAAVREELVADVPVGCFLSGGLDSSLVSSFAVQHSPRIRSYFADFPGWEGSERDDAQRVAMHLSTTHHVEEIAGFSLAGDEPDEPDVFDAFDEPNGDLAIVPTWHLSKAISRHVKVALSGDGGDELFAGYRRHGVFENLPLRRRLSWIAENLRRRFGVGRDWPGGCANAEEYFRFLMCPGFSTAELCALFPGWASEIIENAPESAENAPRPRGSIREWLLLDIRNNLVDNNLARADRASMAHGLEVRVPLLDHRVAELAMSLPAALNPASDGGKLLLRRIASKRLPPELLSKGKQGFSFPLQRYVSLAQMEHAIASGALVGNGLLDREALARWFAAASGGNHPVKLWLLYVLEQWAVRFLFPGRRIAE